MTFIALDYKDWCKGIYTNGQLYYNQFPNNLSRTWRYLSYLEDKSIEYAYIYAQGKSIDDICPSHLKEEWEHKKNKLKAYHRSFLEAKVSLEDNCFFDLVPSQFLMELCEVKVKIIDSIFRTVEKPSNYDLLLNTEKILNQISNRSLNLNLSYLRSNIHDNRARLILNKIKNKNTISYNLFGSKTGRLTTNPDSFPILNLDTKFRSVLKPNNDVFVELDYNAAEVRVLLGLCAEQQPQEDIHTWNSKRLNISREEAKKEIFSWLYGSQKVDSKKYENLFNLNKVIHQFYDGEKIVNPYKRIIKTDNFHKLNYLVQSTANDLVLEQLSKVNSVLKSKKSYISFIVHDSFVIDLAKEDRTLINEIVQIFSQTKFGTFPVNISIGKDYGTLRKI